jgi:formate dehydrogenase subunit delta
MSSEELEHLIKMLNQITDNLASAEDEATRAKEVAAHVKKFWAPSMIKIITEYAEADGKELQPTALAALTSLSN